MFSTKQMQLHKLYSRKDGVERASKRVLQKCKVLWSSPWWSLWSSPKHAINIDKKAKQSGKFRRYQA
jgi:hypothetical protein